jgi:hypothetical protein
MMEKIPGYAASFLSGIQKRGEAKEKRIVHSLAATAEERYNDFLQTILASYKEYRSICWLLTSALLLKP